MGKNDRRSQIARRSSTVQPVIYALCFDGDGIVPRVPVRYCYTIQRTIISPASFSTMFTNRVCCMLYRLVGVLAYLKEDSPDLVSCNFWLNPHIKSYMRSRRLDLHRAVEHS